MKELREIGIKVKKRRDERQHACLENLALSADVERGVVSGGSAAELARSIQSHELTSSQLTSVLISRSRVLGLQKLNAVTNELYDGALACARSVDDTAANGGERPQNGQVLLGIPISIKDHINLNGTDSTAGMLSRCLQPKDKDALVVELLRDAGAVVFCKTNVPQSLMLPETDNHIFGRTVNPWDVTRTSGGSSGGEAALIAARASILGIGTDIAGSIRIPSHMCGIYGFRPTPSRVSTRGVATPFLRNRMGQKTIRLACGPMANHVDDLALVLRAWWVQKMWQADPCVTPKLFDQQVYAHGLHGGKRPIRVGYFTTDNWFEPAPAIVRAVHEAKAALEKAGYQVVEFTPPKDGWQAARLAYGIYGADGNLDSYVRGLEGEHMIPLYKKLLTAANIPNLLRPLVLLTLRMFGEKRLHVLLSVGRSGGLTVREYWELVADVKEFQDAWLHAMDQLQVDALLCPGLALPAWPHGMAVDLDAACSYTFTANILHFPAGAVPITTVQQKETHYRLEDLPPTQRDSIARAAARALEGSAGLPVGVQVWARPNADELCLHVMKDLEKHVGFSSIPEMAKVMMTA